MIEVISEKELFQKMEQQVEPYLDERKTEGFFDAETDSVLHYELFQSDHPQATIVISHGFTESTCKYHELIYYFLCQGYDAAVLDHRGHGFSSREDDDPDVIYVHSFKDYVEDFHTFLHCIVRPWQKQMGRNQNPFFLYGHSMGGCIATRYLEIYPEDFARAVLNAPMLGVNTGNCPTLAAVLLCRIMCCIGRGRERLFFHGPFDPEESFAVSAANSRARHEYYQAIRRILPEYQTSSASYRWLLEAIHAGRKAISRNEAEKITVPVLLFQAGDDTLVLPKAQETLIHRISHGTIRKIPRVRHEIYRAENAVLEPYLQEIFSFFS